MTHQPQEIGLIGGIEKRRIEIVNYDPSWPEKFQRHARIIAGAHVGGRKLGVSRVRAYQLANSER
jgi:GrpB-like predicted nucleotidyltransferase (UPF0157 family)